MARIEGIPTETASAIVTTAPAKLDEAAAIEIARRATPYSHEAAGVTAYHVIFKYLASGNEPNAWKPGGSGGVSAWMVTFHRMEDRRRILMMSEQASQAANTVRRLRNYTAVIDADSGAWIMGMDYPPGG